MQKKRAEELGQLVKEAGFRWAHDNLDAKILSDVSAEELWKHTRFLSGLRRESGHSGEKEAAEYIIDCLNQYDVPNELLSFDAYLSHPKESQLSVYSPFHEDIDCVGQAFSSSTPPGGIYGELIYLDESALNKPVPSEVRDKIVITDVWHLLRPTMTRLVEAAGAIGQIHVDSEEIARLMQVTPVWGTPTTNTAELRPAIPSVCVNKASGQSLINHCKRHPTIVALYTNVSTGWLNVPLPVADIPAATRLDTYLLVGGHLDSWYEGATDNATGNALMLEVARVLSKYRQHLRTGIKIAWWPCHSTGRYAGSTWFADTFWGSLNRDALAYLNVDTPGMQGASVYSAVHMAELSQFNNANIEDITGIPVWKMESNGREFLASGPPGKAGDQSFWGVGLPSIGAFSLLPAESTERTAGPGPAFGWWLHTVHDTLDKVDHDILVRDTTLHVLTAWRICNSYILPVDFSATADQIIMIIEDLQTKEVVDLSQPLHELKEFKGEVETLSERADDLLGEAHESQGELDEGKEIAIASLNKCLQKISRYLIPVTYTLAGRYDQDLAVATPLLPGLAAINEIVSIDHQSDRYRFAMTLLLRERNRLMHSLERARQSIRICMAELGC